MYDCELKLLICQACHLTCNREAMAPKKIKKKDCDNSDATAAELVHSDEKNPQSKAKLKVVSKSDRETVAPGIIKEKDCDIADSAEELVQTDQKNPKSLKPKLKNLSKSLSQEFVQSKEAKTVSEVKIENKNKRKRKKEGKQDINVSKDAAKHLISHHSNREKKIIDEKHEEREQKSSRSIGGMIFMCNAKTKPDCFQYRVMGVSASKQDVVMLIKPGLKLFLYDFDLKLMYGIYEASSFGGMKLEPAAFAGAFPAQVRFRIHKECLPLPERIFKKAIKDSYDEKTRKFKTKLTVEQVKRLTELFRPVPRLHSNAKSSLPELVPVPIVQPPSVSNLPREEILRQQVHREQYGNKPQHGSVPIDHNGPNIAHNGVHSPHPLFLTEKEYRSYGLRSERHLLPTTAPVGAPTCHTYENYRFDHGREQLQSNPSSINNNVASGQKEPGRPNLFFLSEKEYRAYGLKGCQELPNRQTPILETNRAFEDSVKDAFNPYDDSTTSLVNRYLSLPGPVVAASAEPYYMTGRGASVNGCSYKSETKDHLVRLNPERERSHSWYPSHALSDYNHNYHRLGGDSNLTSSTVSSRYSFGGPSLSRR